MNHVSLMIHYDRVFLFAFLALSEHALPSFVCTLSKVILESTNRVLKCERRPLSSHVPGPVSSPVGKPHISLIGSLASLDRRVRVLDGAYGAPSAAGFASVLHSRVYNMRHLPLIRLNSLAKK